MRKLDLYCCRKTLKELIILRIVFNEDNTLKPAENRRKTCVTSTYMIQPWYNVCSAMLSKAMSPVVSKFCCFYAHAYWQLRLSLSTHRRRHYIILPHHSIEKKRIKRFVLYVFSIRNHIMRTTSRCVINKSGWMKKTVDGGRKYKTKYFLSYEIIHFIFSKYLLVHLFN